MVFVPLGSRAREGTAGVLTGRAPEVHMHHTRRYLLALGIVSATLAACEGSSGPTVPLATSSQTAAVARQPAGGGERVVTIMDACDSASFDAGTGNPTACTRSHGVTFDKFIAQLQLHGVAGAWHFAPPEMTARVGDTFVAVNRGGEVHTFTRVAQFGGGIIPVLNQLSGNPVPAPECLALQPDDFIAPGGADRDDTITAPGTTLYECCIHPWMRTVVHAHS